MNRTSTPIDTESMPWMPLGPGVSVRPLRLEGQERTLQLRVEPGVTIARHRHTGAVHAFNVQGSRELIEKGEIAGPGAYVYEPPGNEDSWRCHGDEPCIVQITMTGRVEYVDDAGAVIDYTDTPKLKAAVAAWRAENSLAPLD